MCAHPIANRLGRPDTSRGDCDTSGSSAIDLRCYKGLNGLLTLLSELPLISSRLSPSLPP